MFSLLAGNRDERTPLVAPEDLRLTSDKAKLFEGRLICFLGVTDLYSAFNSSMRDADMDLVTHTADPSSDASTAYPQKKIIMGTAKARGLMETGLAATTVPCGPSWISFTLAAMRYSTLYTRRRKAMSLQMQCIPPKGNDTDKVIMATDDDSGVGAWGEMVRLAQYDNAVPGLVGGGVPARINALLSWMVFNAPGSLPDAFVYNPYAYDTTIPWTALEGNSYVPFITAPMSATEGLKVSDTVSALVQAFSNSPLNPAPSAA